MFAETVKGKPLYEEVRVENLGGNTYRIAQSPGLVQGIAADDVVELLPDKSPRVLKRGGNLAVQIFAAANIDAIESLATPAVTQMGGWLDGKSHKLVVYTIPIKATFARIESVLDGVTRRFPGSNWYFGNVYDPADGVTPLNWWRTPS
jgi:hypothetical protein